MKEYIEKTRRYSIISSSELLARLDDHPVFYGVFGELSLAIAFVGATLSRREFQLLGEIRGANIPLIYFSSAPSLIAQKSVPEEYQPRILGDGASSVELIELISTELEIYEQDFLELPDSASADRYTQFLIDLGGHGRYGPPTRERGVEVIVGDRYDVRGQAGAVGPSAHVHDVSFNQIWSQRSEEIDLIALVDELSRLRTALREKAETPDEDRIVADVGQAEISAKNSDGPGTLRHLRSAGKWALETATAIGINIAAAAIKAATGM